MYCISTSMSKIAFPYVSIHHIIISHSFSHTKSWKSGMHFIPTAHLNLRLFIFQMLNSHIWLGATVLNNIDLGEQFF